MHSILILKMVGTSVLCWQMGKAIILDLTTSFVAVGNFLGAWKKNYNAFIFLFRDNCQNCQGWFNRALVHPSLHLPNPLFLREQCPNIFLNNARNLFSLHILRKFIFVTFLQHIFYCKKFSHFCHNFVYHHRFFPHKCLVIISFSSIVFLVKHSSISLFSSKFYLSQCFPS